MSLPLGLGLVLGTGILFSVIGTLLVRRYEDGPPTLVMLGYILAVGVSFIATAFPWILDLGIDPVNSQQAISGGYGPTMFRLCLSLLIYFYPVYIISQLVGSGFTAATVDQVYWSNITTRPLSSYGRAHAQAMDDNIGSAIREFQTYFDQEPKTPDPLFYAGALLDKHQRHMEANQIYRQARNHFEKDLRIWAAATLRIVDNLEHGMAKRKEARKLLYEVLHRAKSPSLRQLITDRLQAMPDDQETAARN